MKREGRDHITTFKLSGVKNGNPTWKTDIEVDIYYENEKWIIGGGPPKNEKYFISDSSAECPESVESWSNHGQHRDKLIGGKIECDLVIYSLDKQKPKPKTKN